MSETVESKVLEYTQEDVEMIMSFIERKLNRTYDGNGNTYLYVYEHDGGKNDIYYKMNHSSLRGAIAEKLEEKWKRVEISENPIGHCMYWLINFFK